jgi:transposase-like protein
MVLEPVHCPNCDGIEVIKHGTTAEGKQRYRCQSSDCERGTFIREYSYAAYSPHVKQQISDMAINGSSIRDTARVLGISTTTVMETLKKKSRVESSE